MRARPRSRGNRSRIDSKHLYIGIEVAESFFVATAYTTSIVYRVTSGHQNALQLILLGAGFLASVGLYVPFLTGGGLTGALAITLLFVMPETNFRPPRRSVSAGSVSRQAWTAFTGQVRQTHQAIVVVPGLVLLLAMLFFVGMWNESFDRLWALTC